jgi:replicative DNA helicase
MIKHKIKFSFTPEFQLETLRYLIQDKEGGLVIKKIKPSYYVLIEHSIIAEGLVKFIKKKNKVPSKNVLKEVIKELLESKNYVDLITRDDIPNVFKIVDDLYNNPLKDSEYIQEKVYKFATYVEMKNLNESFDLNNFDQYEEYSKKVDKVLQNSKPKKEEEPVYLIKDLVDRQFKRRVDPDVIPSPYRQLNDLTNAGGFPSGSVLVLLDKPKAKKTFFLVNLARGYLKMKKSVLYIDTENGKNQIMDRMIQGSINVSKKDLYSGEYDKKESAYIRKLSRFGVELIIDRVPAMITDCNYIRDLIDKLRANGININVLIIDYAAKLASINKDKDDFERISNVYVDIQNLADEEKLDCIWTANHITREGAKHRETRYEENDISGAISIVRNAQGIYGLNATAQEENDGIQRLEIVVQRDGAPHGRAVFKVDIEKQRAVELTKEQRRTYDEIYGNTLDDKLSKNKKNEPDAKKANAVADI